MPSGQEDYIFLQMQEMFPQLDAVIVYMILSENEFRINDVLSILTDLAQTAVSSNEKLPTNTFQQDELSEYSVPAVKQDDMCTTSSESQSEMRQSASEGLTSSSTNSEVKMNLQLPNMNQHVQSLFDFSHQNTEESLKSDEKVMDQVNDQEHLKTLKEDFKEPQDNNLDAYSCYLPYYNANCDVEESIKEQENIQIEEFSSEFKLNGMKKLHVEEELRQTGDFVKPSEEKISKQQTHNKISTKIFVTLFSYVLVGHSNGKRLVYDGCGDKHLSSFRTSRNAPKLLKKHTSSTKMSAHEVASKTDHNRYKTHDVITNKLPTRNTSFVTDKSDIGSYPPVQHLLNDTSSEPTGDFIGSSHPPATKPMEIPASNDVCVGSSCFNPRQNLALDFPVSCDEKLGIISTASNIGLDRKNIWSNSFSPISLHPNSLVDDFFSSEIFFDVNNVNNNTALGTTAHSKSEKNWPSITHVSNLYSPTSKDTLDDKSTNKNSSNSPENKATSNDSHIYKSSKPNYATIMAKNEHHNLSAEKVQSKNATRCMFLMRGPSGSGKSTLAKEISGGRGVILSTDDYFNTPSGYKFDRTELSFAHEWNQNRTKECLQKGLTPVLIDNTNSTSGEMRPYMVMAVKHGYKIEIREPNTRWKFKASELARRNIHNVPKETIKSMLDRYEPNLTVRSVLGKELFHVYEQNCLIQSLAAKQVLPKIAQGITTTVSSGESLTTPTPASLPSSTHSGKGNFEYQRSPVEFRHKNSRGSSKSDDSDFTIPCEAATNRENKNDTLKSMAFDSGSRSSSATNTNCSSDRDTDPSTPPTTPSDDFHPHKRSCTAQQLSDQSRTALSPPEKAAVSTEWSDTRKRKRKPKQLAPQFQRSKLQDTGISWSSYMGVIEAQANRDLSQSPTDLCPPANCAEAETQTELDCFALLSKIEADLDVASNGEVIIAADSAGFKPATSVKVRKLVKLKYDKSTSTGDMQKVLDEKADLDTLELLFTELKREDLAHIYEKCNKQLDWSTDVIAQSSLFGGPESFLTDGKGERSSSMSLDDYYDAVCRTDTAQSDAVEKAEPTFNLTTENLTMQLPSRFLSQLIEMFGDSGDIARSADNNTVEVDYDLALVLYNTWKFTANQSTTRTSFNDKRSHTKFNSTDYLRTGNIFSRDADVLDQLKKDEELARRIQLEEENQSRASSSANHRKPRKSAQGFRSPKTGSSSSNKWYVDRSHPAPSLQQIMSEESAAEESERRQKSNLRDMKLGAQLKREQLHAMYPNIPSTLLDQIYAASNYNLEQTMFEVNCIFEEDVFSKSTDPVHSNSLEPYFVDRKSKTRPSQQEHRTVQSSPANISDRPLTFDDVRTDARATYEEIRTEANLQRRQIVECQTKAAIATHQKKGALARFYSEQAKEHQKRLREANQRAAVITYKRMNEGRSPNELDLHGLHVDEAIDTLRSVIAQLQHDKVNVRQLTVITGRGLNSSDGIPKIKRAVLEWLKNKDIHCEHVNDGCLKVFW